MDIFSGISSVDIEIFTRCVLQILLLSAEEYQTDFVTLTDILVLRATQIQTDILSSAPTRPVSPVDLRTALLRFTPSPMT